MTLSYSGRGTGAYDVLKDNPHLESSWINSMEFTEDYHLQQGNTLSILRQISQDTIRNLYVGSALQQAYVNSIVGGNLRTKISTTDPRDQATLKKYYSDEVMLDISQTKTLCSINEELVAAAFSDGDCLINLAGNLIRGPFNRNVDGVVFILNLINIIQYEVYNERFINIHVIVCCCKILCR